MYHLSAPWTLRKPSVLLSLPRRRPGQGIGTGECAGEGEDCCAAGAEGPPAADAGGCDDDEEALAATDCCTLLAAAAAAAVVAAVAAVEYEEDVVCLLGCDVVVARLGVAVCWRKAAKTVERKKGRCDGIFAGLVGCCWVSVSERWMMDHQDSYVIYLSAPLFLLPRFGGVGVVAL